MRTAPGILLLLAACATAPSVEEASPGVVEARRLHQAGDLDGAIRAARAAADEDPEAIQPRWVLSFFLEEKGDLKGAFEVVQEIIAAHPTFLAGGNRLGEIFIRAGRREEAARCFRGCLDADPAWVPALVNLGAMAVEEGRAAEAVEFLEKAVEQAPDHGFARLQLANAYALADRPEDARAQVEAAVLCPDLPPARAEEARRFLAGRPAPPPPGR